MGQHNSKKPAQPKCDPEELLQRFITAAGKMYSGYEINDGNKAAIWNLCLYFAGHPDFGMNLDKGLLIMGNVGSGKTTMMRIFSSVVPFTFLYVDNICDNVRREGQEQLDKIKGRPFEELCFDDFGSEAKIKHYGSNYDVMYDVVIRRCQDYVHHKTKTHFTTNMTMEEIKTFYDSRVESRLYEMCNIIIIGGGTNYKDWRKK